nr:hypothetical protein [Streptomyces yerevanensis]
MISTGFVTQALLFLLAVVLMLSLLTAAVRGARTYRRRRRERIVAPVRGLLLELLCAAEDEQSELLGRLARIEKRTWAALEPTVAAMLGKVSGRARTALVRLYELRGLPTRPSPASAAAARFGEGEQLRFSGSSPTVRRPRHCAVCSTTATGRCG